MRRVRPRSSFCAAAACLLAAGSCWAGGPPSRIDGRLSNARTFVLNGNIHPRLASAADQGEVEGTLPLPRITVHFQMTAAQRTDLDSLLQAQQDRSSPQYHKWLTPEQYADRFGVSASDLASVTEWLQSMGFTDIQPARGRTFITMSGTAATARLAFGTAIHRYRAGGVLHYANVSAPVLPRQLSGVVSAIRGLDDFRPQPRGKLRPRLTSEISGNHFLAPGDFATIYNLTPLYNSGLDGTGQRIAIVGQTTIDFSDITAFQNAAGLPAKNPEIRVAGTAPSFNADDAVESDLDIEWAGAVARGATIVFVEAQDVFTAATYAVDNNVAPVLSMTYGACETALGSGTVNSLNSVFQQANAQGITVIAASGDDGAADCEPQNATVATHGLGVDFPASSPYVTGIGGTTFNDAAGNYWSTTNGANGGSALSYIPEVVWNDTTTSGLSATGGGASEIFSKPSWQQGTGVPVDGHRDVPDVALAASPSHVGYLICSAGRCTNGFRDSQDFFNVMGGTSCGSPTFAGIVAIINQATQGSQGDINPTLYSLASISTDAFHDVTSGDNRVPCQAGSTNCLTGTLGYSAGTGYDQTTGLGSVNAHALVTEWSSDFQVSASPASLTVPSGGSATAQVNVTRFANFAGTVSFTCSVPAALTNTTCSIPGTVTGGSGNATLTVNHSAAGALWTPPSWPPYAVLFVATLPALLFVRRKRTRWIWATAAVLSMALVVGCGKSGSNSSNPPPGSVTANVTVTATCGTLSHAITVSVTAL